MKVVTISASVASVERRRRGREKGRGGGTELTQELSSHHAAAASAGKGKTHKFHKQKTPRGPRAVISLYYASAIGVVEGGRGYAKCKVGCEWLQTIGAKRSRSA